MEMTSGPSSANLTHQMAEIPKQQVDKATNLISTSNPMIDPNASKGTNVSFLNSFMDSLNNSIDAANGKNDTAIDMKEDLSMNPEPLLASSYFDLSKFSQMNQQMQTSPMENPTTPIENPSSSMEDPMANEMGNNIGTKFRNPEELKSLLDQGMENHDLKNELIRSAPEDQQQTISDSIKKYYDPQTSEGERFSIVGTIYDIINGEGDNTVPAEYIQASVDALIKESNEKIKQFAKKAASVKSVKKAKSSYNLKKQAQQFAGTGHTEFVNFGPNEKRMLPYSNTGLVGSDWHVWLRARDHNFIFDDHAVDFDTFWRGNIMDKYSQPYRNKKGEWVGGYLNKRFETDHNIPEGNNLQLLPGQLRRPYLPQFATMEARMEDSRSKLAKDRGYSPTDTDAEAYNWHTASSQKKKVIASDDLGIGSLPSIEQTKPLGGVKQCPSCGSDNSATEIICVNCKAPIPKGTRTYNQKQRDKKGKQKGANPHEVVFMGAPVNRQFVPGFGRPIEAQIIPSNKTIPLVNPIKNKKLISDDDAEFVDDHHLSDVENSANELGL